MMPENRINYEKLEEVSGGMANDAIQGLNRS